MKPDRSSFEIFKSNVCHQVKEQGELEFIKKTILSNEVQKLYEKKWYPESLYLVAMVDYLCRKNSIPQYGGYNKLRQCKLNDIIYPSSILTLYLLSKDENVLEESYNKSIPEFKKFNIVESEVENIA